MVLFCRHSVLRKIKRIFSFDATKLTLWYCFFHIQIHTSWAFSSFKYTRAHFRQASLPFCISVSAAWVSVAITRATQLNQTNFSKCCYYNELLPSPAAWSRWDFWNNMMKYLGGYTANFKQPIWNFWLVAHQGSARFKSWPSHNVFHNEFRLFF